MLSQDKSTSQKENIWKQLAHTDQPDTCKIKPLITETTLQ